MWCELGERETVEHLVVECSGHVRERDMMLDGLIELLGENVWRIVIDSEDGGISLALGFGSEILEVDSVQNSIVKITKEYQVSMAEEGEGCP